jgi:hypothetical protein
MNAITTFRSEQALQSFARRNGMKFASACIDSDSEDEAGWIDSMRRRGLAVVWLDNYTPGKGAYLAFHR